MTPTLWKILSAGALSLCSCIASAAPLHYEFSTILEHTAGSDTTGLNGATVHFTAEIADGTTFAPLMQFQTFIPISHQWTITGSGSDDGTYVDQGAMYVAPIGWFGFNGAGFNFASFTELGIFQSIQNPLSIIQAGDTVGPEHFGLFPTTVVNPGIDPDLFLWKTSDGSRYNWMDNAQFSVTEGSAVPAPSTLALSSLALGIVALFSFRRPLAQRASIAA